MEVPLSHDPGHAGAPDAEDEGSGRAALEGFERSLLGRPASMGRREVSRIAGVSIRSARKFWHAMGFPVVQEGDAMFTEADLEALSRVATMVRQDGIFDAMTGMPAAMYSNILIGCPYKKLPIG